MNERERTDGRERKSRVREREPSSARERENERLWCESEKTMREQRQNECEQRDEGAMRD